MKRDHAPAAVRCTGCGSPHHLLHNVRHRGAFHHLCTSCVLKFHTGLFCPVCFDIFDRSPPPPSDSIKCSRCPSLSHSSCVGPGTAASNVCMSCLNPNFLFFDPRPSGEKFRAVDGESMLRAIDMKSAKALLAAARIAAVSMAKAAAATRIEAERKVRESAVARKRAREALERVSVVASRGGELKEVLAAVPSAEREKKMLKRNSTVASAVAVRKRIQNRKTGRGVTVPLSNVQSRETEKLVGLQPQVPVYTLPKNSLSMAEAKETLKGSIGVSGHKNFQKNKLGSSSLRQFHVVPEEKEKRPMFSGPYVLGNQQHQHSKNRHGIEEDKGQFTGFADSEMGPSQILHSKQDATVLKANPGVIFAGSPKTASLIS